MQTFLQPNQMPGLSRNALQLCCSSLQKPTRRQQGLGPQRSRVPCFRQQHGRRQQGLIVVAATPANAKALRAEIEELQEERELALRTAQLNSGKTKKLAHELQGLHKAAFQAVQDNKEILARRLLEEKMQLSEDLSSAEARSSANFNLATRLARVIGDKQAQLQGQTPQSSSASASQPLPPYLGGTPGKRPPQVPTNNYMDDVSRDPWRQPRPPSQPSQPASPTPASSSSGSSSPGAFKSERELNDRFVELERQELERMMKASSPPRDIDVTWKDSSSSTGSSRPAGAPRPPANASPPPKAESSGSASSSSSRPSTNSSRQPAPAQSSGRKQESSRSETGSAGGDPGWWQTGWKLQQRLTGRSTDERPTRPSDGGSSAAHQAEMILQLILDQQRDNAPLQGTDLVALAGRSLRAHLAGREIPSVTSTPSEIRRKVLRAAVNVCLHCLETGKSVLPTAGWASGLSSIIEEHHPQLFIVSITAALDLSAKEAAAALEESLISLCKAALADALPGANRGTASSDAGQASIQRLQQLHAALRPFVDGELAMKFSRVYTELFKGTSERDRLWLLLAFKSVAGKDAAALVAVAEALGVSY